MVHAGNCRFKNYRAKWKELSRICKITVAAALKLAKTNRLAGLFRTFLSCLNGNLVNFTAHRVKRPFPIE